MRKRGALRRVGDRIQDVGRAVVETVAGNVLLFSFLTLGAILIALFFVGLRGIAPSSKGEQTTLTNALGLIDEGDVQLAVLRDQDSRLEILTKNQNEYW